MSDWPSTDRRLTQPASRGRARWTGRGLALLIAANLGLATCGVVLTQRQVPGAAPISIDFVSFYAAGALANAGTPALAYDQAAHRLAEAAATAPGGNYQLFFYPPIYLLLCQMLASLPYLVALAVFEAVTAGLFLVVMRRIAGRPAGGGAGVGMPAGASPGVTSGVGPGAWLVPVLAFSPVFWNIVEGQNAFLTAALLGGGVLLADRRPVLAGMLFGAACYKPHFGLLVPVALLAGRRWRSVAAAAGVVVGLGGLSWLLYGTATWAAYLRLFLDSGHEYGAGRVSFSGMVGTFGASRLAGVAVPAAMVLQGLAGLAAAGVVGWIWWRGASHAVRAAALLSGTMLAVPMALLYDQLITLMALCWLVQEGRCRGFLRGERPLLAGAFLLAVASFPLAATLSLPLAPVPAAILLGLCGARAIPQRSGRAAGTGGGCHGRADPSICAGP